MRRSENPTNINNKWNSRVKLVSRIVDIMRFISKLARHSSITLHGVFGGVGLSSAGNLNQLLFVTMFSDCKWLRSAVAVRLSSGLSTLLVLFLVELDGTFLNKNLQRSIFIDLHGGGIRWASARSSLLHV